MNVGIGFQNQSDAFSSGKLAAKQALDTGGINQACLGLAFCHGHMDAEAFFRGIRSVLPPKSPVVGGSAIGIITNRDIAYDGQPSGVALIEFPEGIPPVASAGRLAENARATGRRLGAQLRENSTEKSLLLFYDSIQRPPSPVPPPVMNASPPLITGIEESLGIEIPIAGAGLLGSYAFEPTHQFDGFEVVQQHAVGVLLDNRRIAGMRIMHGCRPLSEEYHTLTRVQGPVILEIDGRPATEVIDGVANDRSWRKEKPVNGITLGVNHEKLSGNLREGAFVNRLIAGAMPDGEGILMFEPDLEEGAEILFMQRDGQTMIESAHHNATALVQEALAGHRNPALGLYIDCAGRTAGHSKTATEEAAEVQAVFNHHGIPLLGFYSGVEVAPLLGRSRGLDWTGVLILLAND